MSKQKERVIQDRTVRKSVKKAINEIHSEPIWGYVEATINAFTAMRHLPPSERIVYIVLPEINGSESAFIIAKGTGFVKYDYVEKNIGYDTDTEEYIEQQKDPDYLNKMGIGIPSIASLSRDKEAEFRSVTINSKGQEEGLVATYSLKDEGGFLVPAEHPDSKYVFPQGHILNGKTGVAVVIPKSKYNKPNLVYELLSETFARKLKSGYQILLLGPNDKQPKRVMPPSDFSCDNEKVIGIIHDDKLNANFPVYADIQPAQKPADSKLRVLMKKMTIGRPPANSVLSEYQAKGHYGCDIFGFKPDREGVAVDPYDPINQQAEQIVLKEFKRQGIEKKPTEEIKNQKKAKKWKDKFAESFVKYYIKNPQDPLLKVQAKLKKSPLTGKLENAGNVTRPQRRCPNGFHWDKKIGACVVIGQAPPRPPTTTTKIPRGPNTPHFGNNPHGKKKKKQRLDNQYTDQSIPEFNISRAYDPNKFFVWVKDSTVFFNFFYDWVKEAFDAADDFTKDLLSGIAFMNAVPENKALSNEEWQLKLARSI